MNENEIYGTDLVWRTPILNLLQYYVDLLCLHNEARRVYEFLHQNRSRIYTPFSRILASVLMSNIFDIRRIYNNLLPPKPRSALRASPFLFFSLLFFPSISKFSPQGFTYFNQRPILHISRPLSEPLALSVAYLGIYLCLSLLSLSTTTYPTLPYSTSTYFSQPSQLHTRPSTYVPRTRKSPPISINQTF